LEGLEVGTWRGWYGGKVRGEGHLREVVASIEAIKRESGLGGQRQRRVTLDECEVEALKLSHIGLRYKTQR